MPKIKFNGSVVTGNNKKVNTLDEAQRLQAQCDACGCDDKLGYTNFLDLNDDIVYSVFLSGGALYYIENNETNRALFAACCRERKAGTLSGTACDALVSAATAVS